MEKLQFKGNLLAEFLLVLGKSVVVLIRLSNNLMRPIHIVEDRQSALFSPPI